MRIGILTFHWATNYGAILQCYALQTYLESFGHDVKVINYKPYCYDDTLYNFLRQRKFLRPIEFIKKCKREKALIAFRQSHLNLTERIYHCSHISNISSQFDAIISGSDQVMNPFFLLHGEGRGNVTPSYFLGFSFCGKRIGYALSFGCVTYPTNALETARNYINSFDKITVREASGIDIIKSMGRNDAEVVPDPTLLMLPAFYHSLADECLKFNQNPYIYCFFIRNIDNRKKILNSIFISTQTLWNNDDDDYSLEGWLNKIKHSYFVITDSFHCVVMCLKLHKPFVVITELEGNVGMNDRFYTMLHKIHMSDRIVYKKNISMIIKLMDKEINWQRIDESIICSNQMLDDIL